MYRTLAYSFSLVICTGYRQKEYAIIFVIQQHSDRLGHILAVHVVYVHVSIATPLAWKKLVLLRQKLIPSGGEMKLGPLFRAHCKWFSAANWLCPASQTHHFAACTTEHYHTWLDGDRWGTKVSAELLREPRWRLIQIDRRFKCSGELKRTKRDGTCLATFIPTLSSPGSWSW